jgi:ABC-type polysaccharide/polyol phosphate transport system ATPase subunit
MIEPAIRFEEVWKQYKISGSHYRSIREDAARVGKLLARSASRLVGVKVEGPQPRPTFWALKALQLQIQPGERIGIIGPNGAGKTTALRIMARITSATRGRVRTRGKIGALIAVGAGIHPELTGTENIFLYGSIMGLKRAEIRAKFDRIVAFAGVEEFLETPLKYYSSGMRVRLGFAVAVHVDPEIMLVDEVLSVGDYAFQRNCLEKIDELGRNGCTIVFVSHDLYSVKQVCSRVAFLNHGELLYDGDPQEAVNRYLDMARDGRAGLGGATPTGHGVRWGSFEATIEKVDLLDSQGLPAEKIECGEALTVDIHYHSGQPVETPSFAVNIKRNDGLIMCGSVASWEGARLPQMLGRGAVRLTFERLDLAPGSYTVTVSLSEKTGISFFDYHADAYPFTVTTNRRGDGIAYFPVRWDMRGS